MNDIKENVTETGGEIMGFIRDHYGFFVGVIVGFVFGGFVFR